jgi:Flp pilus assembly pilin Flp
MQNFKCLLFRFVRDKCGQDLTEYALIIAVIAFAAAATMKGCATELGGLHRYR